MDLNDYAVELIAAQRLRELRERGARQGLLATGRRVRPPLSRRLGVALIRVGQWLAQGEPGPARNAGVRLAR